MRAAVGARNHRSLACRRAGRQTGESGFIMVWTAIVLLPVLTLGMIFIMYGRASIAKLQAQLNAMNLVAIGTYSAEFDSNESLHAMAMLARAQGFSGAAATRSPQFLRGGDLVLNHDTTSVGQNRLAAFQRISLGPLNNLVAHLGGVEASGVSSSRPAKVLVSVLLDYSRSLLNDRNITDILRAFGVLGSGPGATNVTAGPLGTFNSTLGEVVPYLVAQNALPFGIFAAPRLWLSWNSVGAILPDIRWLSPMDTCQIGPENGCDGSMPTHIGSLMYFISNMFMSYKRAATILVGVLAQQTPYLDVSVLGGPLNSQAFQGVSSLTQPASGVGMFESMSNNGVFPVWRFDETDVKNIRSTGSPSPPFLTADVEQEHSLAEPKNPFEDNVAISPTRLMLVNMGLTGYRKALKYFTYRDELDRPYSFAEAEPPSGVTHVPSASRYLAPPLPNISNPKFNPPPTDSFVYDPGTADAEGRLSGDLINPLGWPSGPVPILSIEGKAHPSSLPAEIANVYVYSSAPPQRDAPPKSNSAPLSKNMWETGFGLCVIRDLLDDGVQNNTTPCTGAGNLTNTNVYYDPAAPSPACPAGSTPRCKVRTGSGSFNPSQTSFVWCLHGYPRCIPFFNSEPGCFRQSGSTNPHQGAFESSVPVCTPDHATNPYPNGHGDTQADPKVTYRGRIEVPSDPPNISTNNLFYMLMDLSPTYGGTFHHEGMGDAISRCQSFKRRTNGTGRCATVLVTDGVINPRNTDGQVVTPLAEALQSLSDRADLYSSETGAGLGGKIFTWFLGKTDTYDAVRRIVDDVYDSLNPNQQAVVENYIRQRVAVPAASCADFESIQALSMKCVFYNAVVLPETESLEDFRAILGGGDTPPENRYWTETSLSNDSQTGEAALGNDSQAGFLNGLRLLLGRLKSEVEFER